MGSNFCRLMENLQNPQKLDPGKISCHTVFIINTRSYTVHVLTANQSSQIHPSIMVILDGLISMFIVCHGERNSSGAGTKWKDNWSNLCW